MYAKLVFPSGTDYTKIARDVVRCINNSDGAGGSTVAALEFVTAADSSIDDTVASDWSLASGQTLGTGSSSVEQDKIMYLQQTHASTATMTVAIGTAYQDSTSGTFTAANNTTYSGICLWPVSDYGESYEAIWGKTRVNQSQSASSSSWYRLTGPEVHIIARDGCLTILGSRTNNYRGYSYSSIIEVDTYENRKGRNRAAMAWLIGANSYDVDYESMNPTIVNQIFDITSTSPFTSDHQNPCNINLIDCLYDFSSNEEYRFVGANFSSSYDAMVDVRSYPTTASMTYYPYGVKRDTSQSTGNSTTFLQYITNDYEIFKTFAGNSSGYWGYGATASSVVPGHSSVIEDPNATPKKPDGTDAVFFRPVVPVFGQMKASFDLSSNGGFYHATGNFAGVIPNNLSDGTDEYVGFKLFSTEGTSPTGVAFKK